MSPRSPGAFMLSTTFHVAVLGAIFLFTVVANQHEKAAPRILELVAGEGDNYAATVAPALGTPGGVKFDQPEPPAPRPEPIAPQPVEPEPTPMVPVPTPPPPPIVKKEAPKKETPKKDVPVPAPKKELTMKQKLLHKIWAAEGKAKEQAKKERAEAEKRAKAAALAERKTALAKGPRIDAEGIAKGVLGGSTDNKVGGGGGKALTSSGGAVMDRYFSLLIQRAKNALDKPPDLSDDLAVMVRVRIFADGRLSAKVVQSSGSPEWDRAVVAAFARVQMPEHPEHKSEEFEVTFRTKDTGEG